MSSLFQRALGWYGLGFPGCCSRASFSCGENGTGLRLESLGETTLASRGALCKTPLFGEVSHCLALIPGESWDFRARSGLRHTSGFTSRQEGFAMQLRGHHLEPRSGLITGDFAYRNAPIPPLCRGKKIAKWVIFSRTHLLSEPDLRLFLRDRHVIGLSRLFRSLLIPLGISVESPVLEIACLDSRSGLILGESHRDFSDIVGILDRLDYTVARSRFESSMFWNHGWNIRL